MERLLQSKSKLAKKAESVSLTPWCLALAPHFVHNDHVTVSASIEQGTRFVAGCSAQLTCMSFTAKPGCRRAGATLERHHDYVSEALLRLRDGYILVMLWLPPGRQHRPGERACCGLPCQPGENKFVCNPLSSSSLLPASYLTPCHPGFSKQCG